ncbi:MAG TPA: hypothetical protein VG738_01395 [Chitinophagaceae bacterium]|nr:hypothetical protein [Chitinophagaceae bacterium]
MKHLTKIQLEIANLEYHSSADCVELRLYLLSLMREFVRQYQQLQDRQKAQPILKVYKVLQNLYKSFTAITNEKGCSHKAQFEFAKAIIADQVEATTPIFQTSTMAVA